MNDVNGWTAAGFEGVRAQFEANIAAGMEIGAGFAAYYRGEKVVDVWGGIADEASGRPWAEDTLALVFSTTKGMTAICAHRLVDAGLLDLDAPVAKYWPEFAQAGKADIPVRYLLTHECGLAWIDEKLTLDEALDWTPVIEALERQTPHWEPGTQHGYHAVTYGNLVGEVIRRVDGRTVGTYLYEEIAKPLGLDMWIGLPEAEEPRVATLSGGMPSLDALDENVREMINQFIGPETVLGKALNLGGAFADTNVFNEPAVHRAEVPAAGGITDARSLARLYAATVGEVDGIRLLSEQQMRLASKQATTGPNTVILNMDLQFGLGFIVPSSLLQVGGPNSFGHFGLGGSGGWADPDAQLTFGYVPNKLDMGLAGDTRIFSLINACYAAIA